MLHCQLTPLQSRLAASLCASCILILLYLTLFSPQLALAEEVKPRLADPLDPYGNESPLPALSLPSPDGQGLAGGSPLDPTYEPEFSAFDRSILGRAPVGITVLSDHVPVSMNVIMGSTQQFMHTPSPVTSRETVEGGVEEREERAPPQPIPAGENATATAAGRQMVIAERKLSDELGERDEAASAKSHAKRPSTAPTICISANTCIQPGASNASLTNASPPPQLTLYISTSSSNQSPGPSADATTQTSIPFEAGAVMYNLNTSGNVYIGVYATNATGFAGQYNFQLAASASKCYFRYKNEEDADLVWVDSDSQDALLETHNLTMDASAGVAQKMMSSQPYVVFAQRQADAASTSGLVNSYCGLQNYAQIAAIKNGQRANMVTSSMTTRGAGGLPKQQFLFSGLNASTAYFGILAKSGSSSSSSSAAGKKDVGAGGGRVVFRATNFSTKSDHGNCRLVTGLDFCSDVAYSVPSNPQTFPNATVLGQWYDGLASAAYATFEMVLAQIPCEAPSTQRYSLARTCSDCAAAYKAWVCSVLVPRCDDFASNASYLHPRAISQPFPNASTLTGADQQAIAALPNTTAFNTSRNPAIDSTVQPGPYKEVLPCDDLCYSLVQNCPASMGFSCPQPGGPGFASSYGQRAAGADKAAGAVLCNYPGSAHLVSAANRLLGGGGRAGGGGLGILGSGMLLLVWGFLTL